MSPHLIPIFSIVFGTIMVVFIRRFIHIERLNMIERGINPSDIKNIWRKKDPYRFLRNSLTAIGVGIGLVMGAFMEHGYLNRYGGMVLAGSICIFGGLGLLIGFITQIYLQNKYRKEGSNPSEEEI